MPSVAPCRRPLLETLPKRRRAINNQTMTLHMSTPCFSWLCTTIIRHSALPVLLLPSRSIASASRVQNNTKKRRDNLTGVVYESLVTLQHGLINLVPVRLQLAGSGVAFGLWVIVDPHIINIRSISCFGYSRPK